MPKWREKENGGGREGGGEEDVRERGVGERGGKREECRRREGRGKEKGRRGETVREKTMTKGIVQTACREGAVEWHVRHASRQEEKVK